MELDLLDYEDIDSVATFMEEEKYHEGTGSLNHNHDEMASGSETNSNSDTESTPIIGDFLVQTLRRSSRTHKLPAILNEFVVDNLKEDVYMTIPQGFGNTDNKNLVYKVNKSLYGLKQAPRKWNEKLVGILRENGFVQSCSDHSLFTKTVNNIFVALLVYVDDIVITDNDENEIKKFKQFLSSKCQIKDLGLLKYFIGIEVIKQGDDIYLSQRKYCLKLLHEFDFLAFKPVSVHMVANTVLPFKPSHDNPYLDNITGNQKLVGILIYLTHTRPDISYFIHCLSQHMHSPLKSHLQSALNVLRYLKGSPRKGLKFTHNQLSNMLEGYADSDWPKCPKTRKSVSGYCVFYNGNLIS
uniref:Ribonuclease H-like domain-containing protein n=1 Tax=Tanacetum cinerariifolium TaxID=118510 RepID=A0A699I8D5_TANCI|nr:ribonuclease H-like domain-containing protein [Tanacetum cinerariifolium]